jgi:hypothetical protein
LSAFCFFERKVDLLRRRRRKLGDRDNSDTKICSESGNVAIVGVDFGGLVRGPKSRARKELSKTTGMA